MDLNAMRLKLYEEKKKNAEARIEIAKLKKKAAYEKKYKSLKQDFGILASQFETSEMMRNDQSELIDALKQQVSRMKKINKAIQKQLDEQINNAGSGGPSMMLQQSQSQSQQSSQLNSTANTTKKN